MTTIPTLSLQQTERTARWYAFPRITLLCYYGESRTTRQKGVWTILLTVTKPGCARNTRLQRMSSLEVIEVFQKPSVLTLVDKDSDTNPNTTASSIAGDTIHVDGRKRRSEATQLRKSVFGKKHNRLDESKAWFSNLICELGNVL